MPSETQVYRFLLVILSLAVVKNANGMVYLFDRANFPCGPVSTVEPSVSPPHREPSVAPSHEPSRSPSVAPPLSKLCGSTNSFETCDSAGDPCGTNGLCIRTVEGWDICATDSTAILCNKSNDCLEGYVLYLYDVCVLIEAHIFSHTANYLFTRINPLAKNVSTAFQIVKDLLFV